MEIDEAIETIEIAISYAHFPPHSKQEKALRLSIEALIFTKNVLNLMPIVFQLPLPGETKE